MAAGWSRLPVAGRRALWAIAAASAALVVAAPARATTADEALAKVNALRATHGLPGPLVENKAWSKACELHLRYLARNNAAGHEEDRRKPGYTPLGAWAGMNSILAFNPWDWEGAGTPFRTAPFHFVQLLSPLLTEVGISTFSGRTCITTWPGYRRSFDGTMTFSFPADGTTAFPYAEQMAESPFTPLSFIFGLEEGDTTGPALYVFSAEWGARPLSVWLTGPEGGVDLTWFDHAHGLTGGLVPSGAAIIVPLKPLRPESTYTVEVAFSNMTVHRFSFTTTFAEVRTRDNSISLGIRARARRAFEIRWASNAPSPMLTIEHANEVLIVKRLRGRRGSITVRAGADWDPGRYEACVYSGGGSSGFYRAYGCNPLQLP